MKRKSLMVDQDVHAFVWEKNFYPENISDTLRRLLKIKKAKTK